MLSRNADSLFWMGRYIERADYLARILDAGIRLSALPAPGSEPGNEWQSALLSAGAADAFAARHGEATEMAVRDFLAFDPAHGGSIVSCLTAARMNARSVRPMITAELWEAINDAWNSLARRGKPKDREKFTGFLDWVKTVSLAFDGAAHRTLLRNDGYHFLRLGTELGARGQHRAAARCEISSPAAAGRAVGGGLDFFHWTTLLREVSAVTAYRWLYRETVKPWLVADLMILNRKMPRSLASCQHMIVIHLDGLADDYGRQGESQRLAAHALRQLEDANMTDIFQSGLHEFIEAYLSANNRLGLAIVDQYLR